MAKYKKCPRCELNYITVDTDYCDVCKAEMKLISDDSLNEDMELCPVCGQNFVSVDQVMCDECSKKRSLDDVVDEIDEDASEDQHNKEDWDSETKALKSLDETPMENEIDDDIEVVNFADLEEEDDDDDYYDDDDDSSVDHFEDEDDFDFSKIDDEDFEDDDDEDDNDDDDDDFIDDIISKRKK